MRRWLSTTPLCPLRGEHVVSDLTRIMSYRALSSQPGVGAINFMLSVDGGRPLRAHA